MWKKPPPNQIWREIRKDEHDAEQQIGLEYDSEAKRCQSKTSEAKRSKAKENEEKQKTLKVNNCEHSAFHLFLE